MWYKFSEKNPKAGDDIIMYSSMTDSIASGIYNDKMCNQSVFDYWSLTPGKDVLVPKCLQPTPAEYSRSTWHSYKEEKPEDGAYCFWSYLPKEFMKNAKKEIHIWLDYSGCMPKACYSTYIATRNAIKNKEKYINTTQASIYLPSVMADGYKVFVHAGSRKGEITKDDLNAWGDNIILKIMGEWNL